MEHSTVHWNLRGFGANYEELVLLSKQYKPAVIAGDAVDKFKIADIFFHFSFFIFFFIQAHLP